MFDPGARGALASYLERAPRCYDKELASLDKERRKVLARLHALVFKVYLRLTTLKESDVSACMEPRINEKFMFLVITSFLIAFSMFQ